MRSICCLVVPGLVLSVSLLTGACSTERATEQDAPGHPAVGQTDGGAHVGDADTSHAAEMLTTAREMLDRGRTTAAALLLNELIDQYPASPEAAEARVMLRSIGLAP